MVRLAVVLKGQEVEPIGLAHSVVEHGGRQRDHPDGQGPVDATVRIGHGIEGNPGVSAAFEDHRRWLLAVTAWGSGTKETTRSPPSSRGSRRPWLLSPLACTCRRPASGPGRASAA